MSVFSEINDMKYAVDAFFRLKGIDRLMNEGFAKRTCLLKTKTPCHCVLVLSTLISHYFNKRTDAVSSE